MPLVRYCQATGERPLWAVSGDASGGHRAALSLTPPDIGICIPSSLSLTQGAGGGGGAARAAAAAGVGFALGKQEAKRRAIEALVEGLRSPLA